MKKVLLSLAVAGAAFMMISSGAHAWTCRATSATGGWGLGTAPSHELAASIAIQYCAVNTPQGYWCLIRDCW